MFVRGFSIDILKGYIHYRDWHWLGSSELGNINSFFLITLLLFSYSCLHFLPTPPPINFLLTMVMCLFHPQSSEVVSQQETSP